MKREKGDHLSQVANKLCSSCRRMCKQASAAVVAQCPRYYPYCRKPAQAECAWKQMELAL